MNYKILIVSFCYAVIVSAADKQVASRDQERIAARDAYTKSRIEGLKQTPRCNLTTRELTTYLVVDCVNDTNYLNSLSPDELRVVLAERYKKINVDLIELKKKNRPQRDPVEIVPFPRLDDEPVSPISPMRTSVRVRTTALHTIRVNLAQQLRGRLEQDKENQRRFNPCWKY